MGRYDFRPARVHEATTQLLTSGRIPHAPPWYNTVGSISPAQILVRTQPIQHHHKRQTRKPSKLFQPQRISYQEDSLRREFFTDHPWELARPRIVLENDGKDMHSRDWSTIRQPGQPLSGESVVQRQMWLMHHQNLTKAQAYDQARREFYKERLQEDVERRVAKEEAMATGAYFGKSMLMIGMELEDKVHRRWREWALKDWELEEQRRASDYTGSEKPLVDGGAIDGGEAPADPEDVGDPSAAPE